MHKTSHAGFVLLEIIISVALFSVVATSMVVALNHLGRTSTTARKESRIFRRMDSVMTELVYRPGFEMDVGQTSYPADATGVSVEVSVALETLTSNTGANLNDLYRVRLTGRLDAEPDIERSLERIVYSPPINNRTLLSR
jgi:Tfp pilus assembly protein PilV